MLEYMREKHLSSKLSPNHISEPNTARKPKMDKGGKSSMLNNKYISSNSKGKSPLSFYFPKMQQQINANNYFKKHAITGNDGQMMVKVSKASNDVSINTQMALQGSFNLERSTNLHFTSQNSHLDKEKFIRGNKTKPEGPINFLETS